MKTLPSKELMSEVLGVNVITVYERKGEIRFKTFTNRGGGWSSGSDTPIPNIAELALIKCKEWAIRKGFQIDSCLTENNISGVGYYGYACVTQDDHFMKDFSHVVGGEADAIIQACEWIRQSLKANA